MNKPNGNAVFHTEPISIVVFDGECSVLVSEDGEHEIALIDETGERFFYQCGRGSARYQIPREKVNGSCIMKAVTSSYVLTRRVYIGR